MANKKIVINVMGGCVEVDTLPVGINLEIRDYDVEGDWDPENIACKEDQHGRYQEMIFGKDEEKEEKIEFSASGDQCFTNKNERIRCVLSQILDDLPSNIDWLDPAIEAEARDLVKEEKPNPFALTQDGLDDMGEPEIKYRNYYKHCGEEWDDEWSCMCNDECPICKAEIEPYKSEDI